MLSQVKRKQKLLLTLTLTVLIAGSILAFSIQEVYSAKSWNSSKSNTSSVHTQLRADLLDLKSNFGVYLEGNNVESYIDNMIMRVDEAEIGLNEMNEFFLEMSVELESLKQTAGTYLDTDSDGDAPGVHVFVVNESADSIAITLEGTDLLAPGDPINDIDINIEQIPGGGVLLTLTPQDPSMAPGDPIDDVDINIEQIPGGSIAIAPEETRPAVPKWIQNNAKWFGEGLIGEKDFVLGLEWMIKNGIIRI